MAELHLVFRADPVSVRQSLSQMMGLPPLDGLPPDDRAMAELVLAEILNNVSEHAYGEGGGQVSVSIIREASGVRCRVIDEGRAMPGGQLPQGRLPGRTDTALADLPEGGFGWHLIRAQCSELTYDRVDGRNRLGFLLQPSG